MKNLSTAAKVYILSTILAGLGLILWSLNQVTWTNPALFVLAILGAAAQTYKVEGPNDKVFTFAWLHYLVFSVGFFI